MTTGVPAFFFYFDGLCLRLGNIASEDIVRPEHLRRRTLTLCPRQGPHGRQKIHGQRKSPICVQKYMGQSRQKPRSVAFPIF